MSNFSQAPLRVQKSFYPEPICHSVILHTAGGVVGGDRLDLDLQLQTNAQVLVTSATAGKVYGGAASYQNLRVRLDRGTCLEWVPQETIIFNGANFVQSSHIELEQGALWLGWEITRLGRTARGEQFATGTWRSHFEVWRHNLPLWIDRQELSSDSLTRSSYNGLHNCPVVGTLTLIGEQIEPDLYAKILELVRGFNSQHQGEISISYLIEGLICRYRGHSSLEVRQWFIEVWQYLRLHLIHRSVCIPRVWMN